ncbi:MAG: 1-deoxy-D-xylulose-5-phosphate synthase [Oscillospiraceae bacterium]|nr:1-deoxy-D-xylulose-5-phosphate synthase [Oscillospiraceae bacterium]
MLETINGHDDLVGLNPPQRQMLCQEIRRFLVDNISKTGGHLASNLGVVELTVALETVFDTQNDRLVFDVGHQSYVHKLLTGRQGDFACLRQFGGIAGFPKPSESDADAFVAGHASSSISIALGMARARTLQKQNYNVVALIGDGAATGGMTYEGLNDTSASNEPMIVILNDNEMSIDRNVGGMAKHLSRLRTKERYLGAKEQYRKFLSKSRGGYKLYQWSRRVKDWFKRVLIPTTIFENMGLTYLGPVDGHDVEGLIRLLNAAREMNRPVLLHVITQKGKGFLPAEERPDKYHGVGKFDPNSGQVNSGNVRTFSEAFGETLVELAAKNPQVCAITAAMPGGTGLLKFKDTFGSRFFDVGIAEEHAVSMAGGLAKQGMVPVVAIYSTFLQRAYDQIMLDVALLKLHVVFSVDRAGLVGEDGETHHGIFDVGYLSQIPGMTVLCPASCLELSEMLTWSVDVCNGPVVIRYPRGGDRSYSENGWPSSVVMHRKGKDLTLITYGVMLDEVMKAAELLSQSGIEASVLRLLSVNPLPLDGILENLPENKNVFVVEEVCKGSGIAEKIAYALGKERPGLRVIGIDLGDNFVTHGTLQDLYAHCGLGADGIANKAQEVLCVEN